MSTNSGMVVRALFPGQGSQAPGMGRSLALAYRQAAEVFDEASDALGLDMRALCWDADAQELAQTQNAQPALITVGVAAWRALEVRGVRAVAAAGHSVGAIAALVAARRLAFADAVRLVRLRGELMASAPGEGGMTAVIAQGLERAEALAAVERLGLDVAADNSPRQFVAAGDLAALRTLADLLGPRAKPLAVSHAFHSRLMAPVAARWQDAVAELKIGGGRVPVGLVTTGAFSTEPEELAKDLAAALCSPVRWQDVMTEAEAFGPAPYAAFGPGTGLVGLAKQHPVKPRVALVDSPVTLDALVRRLELGDAK